VNVARQRRRLVAARRYAARKYLPGQAPRPLWDLGTTRHDSDSVLRAAGKIAHYKCRTLMAQMIRDHRYCDDGSDCGGWTWDPPCGGCSRCIWEQTLYYSKYEEYRSMALSAGLELRYRRAHGYRWGLS